MNVQDMLDHELNRELAKLQGHQLARKVDYGFKVEYDDDVIALTDNRHSLLPKYCSDIVASLEVQKVAIETDVVAYLAYLSGIDEDFYSGSEVADMLTASPRKRAEAAYMTLRERKQS